MSKMNWEHRKRMDKVKSYPPAPSASPRKKKKKKPKRYDPKINHVLLGASDYPGTCRECTRRVEVGDKIWWSPKGKYVVHFYCFEEFMKSNTPA